MASRMDRNGDMLAREWDRNPLHVASGVEVLIDGPFRKSNKSCSSPSLEQKKGQVAGRAKEGFNLAFKPSSVQASDVQAKTGRSPVACVTGDLSVPIISYLTECPSIFDTLRIPAHYYIIIITGLVALQSILLVQ
ncbi:MAG: hypothetical protein Q9212_002292 [Teloschistes hypoglaucus]